MLEKSGFVGAATGIMGGLLFGFDSYYTMPIVNTRLPLLYFTIPLGVANSFVADGMHTFINKHIPLGKKSADQTTFLLNAGISGASLIALMGIIDPTLLNSFNLLPAFLVGAIGEIVGTGTYEYLAENMYI